MNKRSDKVLSLQIAVLQGFYWMIYCPIISFASVYLLSKDFSNQKIGWVIAISNVLAVILQPVMGTLADRVTKISLKALLCFLSVLCLAMVAYLIFFDLGFFWLTVLYVGIIALLLTMVPLVNALTFRYINAGHNVSFGMTRAMGSICFAVLSTLLGIWVNRFSPEILPVICAILLTGLIIIVLSFPKVGKQEVSLSHNEPPLNPHSHAPAAGFLTKYERFLPLLIGIACLFIFHTVVNAFLPQIITSVGGRETDLGVSLTIAALCELPAFFGFSYLVSKFNTSSLLKFSGVFYVLRSLVLLLATTVWMINLGQLLQGLSFAVFIPASVYYINEIMREEDKVKGQAYITGTMTLGSFFGSVIGGWLLDLYGVPAIMIFGAGGAVAGCLLMIYSTPKLKKTKITSIESQV